MRTVRTVFVELHDNQIVGFITRRSLVRIQPKYSINVENHPRYSYNVNMNKWLVWAGAIIAGVAVGFIVAIELTEKSLPLCPACGRRLIIGEDFAVCKSCGVSIPLHKPSE